MARGSGGQAPPPVATTKAPGNHAGHFLLPRGSRVRSQHPSRAVGLMQEMGRVMQMTGSIA